MSKGAGIYPADQERKRGEKGDNLLFVIKSLKNVNFKWVRVLQYLEKKSMGAKWKRNSVMQRLCAYNEPSFKLSTDE